MFRVLFVFVFVFYHSTHFQDQIMYHLMSGQRNKTTMSDMEYLMYYRILTLCKLT